MARCCPPGDARESRCCGDASDNARHQSIRGRRPSARWFAPRTPPRVLRVQWNACGRSRVRMLAEGAKRLRDSRIERIKRGESCSGASRALRPRTTIMAGGGLLRGATTLGGLLPLGGKRELKRPRRVREVVVVRRGSSSRPEPLGTQKLTRRINATALFDEQRSNSRTCKRSSRRLLVTQARPTMPRGRTRIRPRPGRPHGRTIVGKEWFPCSGRRPRR